MALTIKRVFSLAALLVIALVFILLAVPEWPGFQEERYNIDTILGQRHFDFLAWGAKAVAAKSEAQLTAGDKYLDQNEGREFVLTYLGQLDNARRLEAQINQIYTDPFISNPKNQTGDLQKEVDQMRADLAAKQPIAESILQNQVSTIIGEEGFNFLGSTWPPVQMQMTSLPMVLIISPRDEIKQIYNLPLVHGLSTDEREQIESEILDSVDLAALVAPIRGMGFYPAMIIESGDVVGLTNTIAHEWAHHWLTLHPVGLNIFSNNQLLAVNETMASILGNEIGHRVLERYYPEFVPPEETGSEAVDPESSDPDRFNFNREMRTTRILVDELLDQGKVEEAEAYMEERRQFFWDNGYRLRKLNQAYFAFHGSYADEPGEQGDDPIGPAILAVRENSSSLYEFMDRLASITSIDELFEIAEMMEAS